MRIDTRDIILPICNLDFYEPGRFKIDTASLVGTCFLIGGRGYALTAGHVIDQIRDREGHVLLRNETKFDASLVYEFEAHPDEDVGIIRFDHTRNIASPIALASDVIRAGQDYYMWSYPQETSEEVEYFANHDESYAPFRPSIVFFKGYLRRTINHSPNPTISIYRGNRFFEVSEIGGACASGSPLLTLKGRVFAIYVGENGARCGYASVLSRLLSWSPNILGCTICQEATSGG